MSIIKTIKFFGINSKDNNSPESSEKNLPNWFKKQKRIIKDSQGNDLVTWKGCPALYDAFASGYILKTPCDIEVSNNKGKKLIIAKRGDYSRLIVYRGPITGYEVPVGFDENSYVWEPNWRVTLPKGYSALFIHPINRSDLPFFTTGGIIDSDVFSEYGSFPFFIKSNFTGIIPEGTPYMQIIPFKRENWNSEIIYVDPVKENIKKNTITKNLRVPRGGMYFKNFWNKKRYS